MPTRKPSVVSRRRVPSAEDAAWFFTERPCAFSRRLATDALFTLGNGYLGCRGFFEEEQQGIEALGGIYMAGVFGAGDLKAWRGMHRELVNTPNVFRTSIRVDGEPVLARPGRIRSYVRTLNMRDGILTRSMVWRGAAGACVRFDFERFISVADRHVGGQRICITPLAGTPRIELACGIDALVTQHNLLTTLPLPVQPGRRQLETVRQEDGLIETRVATLPNGVRIAEGQQVTLRTAEGSQTGRTADQPDRIARRFQFKGRAGETAVLSKTVAWTTSRDGDAAAGLDQRMAAGMDYDPLLAAHRDAWAARWRAADIRIDGSIEDQRAIRFNLFHLMQAAPTHDWRVSLGARGLSGEMHEGSVFWDNEIFKLPFFTFTDPAATRSMLRFRHHTLPEARRHARDLWFQGAMYAWKSGVDGVEETEMGVGAYYAIHIVADIAYALRQYWDATGDDDFMLRYGTEMLIETARFWVSRVTRDPSGNGFNLMAVRGPNEYDVIVHNNAYTNRMARANLEYAIDAAERMRRTAPTAWKRLAARLRLAPGEPRAWRRCAREMVIPRDARRDLILEDDRYLHRAAFDRRRGKPDARRVIDGTLPYEAMAYYQITKQSDVITLMNLLSADFSATQQRAAYRFYEPRTVHDSSLSYAPHAVMAARLKLRADAYRYFRECAYLDIADRQLNTISGLHLANLGGTWQAVVQGFAGLRIEHGRLCLDARLPTAWKSMRFRLQYRGATLRVDVNRAAVTVLLEQAGPRPLTLMIDGRTCRLQTDGQTAGGRKERS